MTSQPPSAFSGFDLATGDRILFFLKVAIVALIFVGYGVGSTALLATAACAAMGYEWTRLTTRGHEFDAPILPIAMIAAALPAFISYAAGPAAALAVSLLGTAFLLLMGPMREQRLVMTAPGIILIGLAGLCFVMLRGVGEHGVAMAAWLLLVVVATELGSAFRRKRDGDDAARADYGLPRLATGLACGVVAGFVVAAFYREGHPAMVFIASALTSMSVLAAGEATQYVRQRVGAPDGSLFFGRGSMLENMDGFVWASVFAGFMTMLAGPFFGW